MNLIRERELVGNFSKKHPGVSYDIFTATADLVKEQMDKGLIDLGLLLEPVDIEKYEFIRLAQKEKWVVLMRADDELAKKEFCTHDGYGAGSSYETVEKQAMPESV